MLEAIKYIGYLLKRLLQHLFLAIFILGIVGIPIGTLSIINFLQDFSSKIDYTVLDNFEFYGQRVKMLDEEGHIIKTYLDQKDTIKLDLTSARQDYINLFVDIEDKRFYEHGGVDFKGIIRALYVNLTNGKSSQGASTLTQQLVRSQVLTMDKTITRKLTEMFLSLTLEKQVSKEEILEMYLNTTYFGYGNYGIESASHFYYGTTFNDLTMSQLCSLIPIAQSPNNFNPVNDIELNNKKRVTVLKSLFEQGALDEVAYNSALSDESYKEVKMSREEYNESVTSIDSYYVESAYEQVITDLMAYKEMTREEVINFLKENGCLIYTYYDEEIETMLNQLAESRYEAVDNEIQTAVIILNNEGQVKGILGGYDKKPTNYSLNRAMQSTRSPGSTFKPLAVYTTVIEKLKYTSSTTVMDEKREYPTLTGTYAPNNYNDKYVGPIPLYEAVAKSINSVAVDLYYQVGTKEGFDNAKQLGITTLVENRDGFTDNGLSTALGGLTDGVKVIDMAVAYNSIKTSNYTPPRFYKKVVDKDGNLILFTDELPKYQKEQVLKESTSAYMMDALKEVVLNGTGRILKDAKVSVLGKTGTTNDEKDLWFVGSTPNYTISLWYGYDTPKQIPTSNKHVKLYKEIVNQLVDLGKESSDDLFTVKVTSSVYNALHNKSSFVREEPDTSSIVETKPVEDATTSPTTKPYTVVEPYETETPEIEVQPSQEPLPTEDEEELTNGTKPILTPEQDEAPSGYDSGNIFGEEILPEITPTPLPSESPIESPIESPTVEEPSPSVEELLPEVLPESTQNPIT